MTIEELLIFGKSHCHSDHAKILLAELIKKNPLELLNYLKEEVPEEVVIQYKESILALKEGKPLQYVLGKVNFYGNEFMINQNVLIPRFETEELVEKTLEYINKYWKEPIDVIDLGCGSGVIGLSIEKKTNTNSVDLVDISKEALEVSKQNKEKLHSNATLMENDFLEGIKKKYDVIISNQPYIKTNEKIEEIVRKNEPHLALYAGEKGLDCYEKIIKNIKNNMKEKCLVAFEIGFDQKEEITKLINKYLENVKIETKQDLSGRDRMLFILQNLE